MSVLPQSRQIPLKVNLSAEASFENFICESSSNRQAIDFLKAAVHKPDSSHGLIWGAHGSGLTHCLSAVCNEAQKQSRSFAYLPLAEFASYNAPEVCAGLNQLDIVCLGGIDYICGIQAWEQEIFYLYNNLKDLGKTLLVSSYTSPRMLPILLADLKSRLLGVERFRLTVLTDKAKIDAMVLRAEQKGINMPEDVAQYLLRHTHRGVRELFNLLEKLDESQLIEQRKLTKPFIKKVLSA